MKYPKYSDLLKAHKIYQVKEGRDPMYKVATFLVNHFWGKYEEMTDGLGVLLLTWNQAFYRYGPLDFVALQKCIKKNFKIITSYRKRSLISLSDKDENKIRDLFYDFLDALKIHEGKVKGRRSPVAVAKALHLLAPKFFPIWDDKIARRYDCYYSGDSAEKYIEFCKVQKNIIYTFGRRKVQGGNILKLIDEYNYSKYTRGWI